MSAAILWNAAIEARIEIAIYSMAHPEIDPRRDIDDPGMIWAVFSEFWVGEM